MRCAGGKWLVCWLALSGASNLAAQDAEAARTAARQADAAIVCGTAAALVTTLEARLEAGTLTAAERVALAVATQDPAGKLGRLEEAVLAAPHLEMARGLLAQQYLALGRPAESAKTLLPVPASSHDPQVVMARARDRLRLGYPASACDYLFWAIQIERDPEVLTEYVQMSTLSDKVEGKVLDVCLEHLAQARMQCRSSSWCRDSALLGKWSGSSRYSFMYERADFENMSPVNAALAAMPLDAETQYAAALTMWRLSGWGAKAALTERVAGALRASYTLNPRRADVAIWRGIEELCAYPGDPVAGSRLLAGITDNPTAYAGPVLVEMAAMARGLHAYFLGSYRLAARELLKAARHEGWGQALLMADALAAGGDVERALEIAEAWAISTRARAEPCQRLAERLRDFLDGWGFSPFTASQAEDLADVWYQGAYDRAPGGPHQTLQRWLESMRREGRDDWIRGLFGGYIGGLVDRRELERLQPGATLDLPPPSLSRTRERPLSGKTYADFQAAAAAEWNRQDKETPSTGSAHMGGFVLAIGLGMLFASTRVPAEAPRVFHVFTFGSSLAIIALGVWFLSPASWRRPIRARVIPVVQTYRARKNAAAETEPPPDPGKIYTPHKAIAALLTQCGVPLQPVPPPASLAAILEATVDHQSADGLAKSFMKLSPATRQQQLSAAGADAYPYLMQKLALGHELQQECAAGYLAAMGMDQPLPLLRYVAHEHVARAMKRMLDTLPLALLTESGADEQSMAHNGECLCIEALVALKDRSSVPLLADALETSDGDVCVSAQKGLIRLTGAVGPRSAYQWRTMLASEAFGKTP